MGPAERRREMMNVLLRRREETMSNLANEFHVSRRTVINDIAELSLTYPVETSHGRYGGGVKIAEWYHPSRSTLSPEQANAIRKASEFLEGDERKALMSILTQFSAS